MDAARQIMAAEGVRSFFKGAGANILRGVAGAGVLSIYDQGLSTVSTNNVHVLTLSSPTAALRQEIQGRLRLDNFNHQTRNLLNTLSWIWQRMGCRQWRGETRSVIP